MRDWRWYWYKKISLYLSRYRQYDYSSRSHPLLEGLLVLVADAAGNPVAGVNVTASVVPLSYTEGYYEWNEKAERWVQVTTSPYYCQNEDTDCGGILDDLGEDANGDNILGEDVNSNDMLTPGDVAVVTPTTTTDASGFGTLSLIYPEQYASWVRVKLEDRASVAGSEAVAVATFVLPGLNSDYADKKLSPPGDPSPFEISNTCYLE